MMEGESKKREMKGGRDSTRRRWEVMEREQKKRGKEGVREREFRNV